MRSSRSSAAVALALAIAAGGSMSAHRTDEYLQAARLAIDPARVQIELDLTPGIAVAGRVLGELDGDRDGSISAAERQHYLARVRSAVTLDVDGTPLDVRVTGSVFPSVDAVRKGEGTIRIELTAAVTRLAAGPHQLRYRNAYRSDIGAYLANALVPASARVSIRDQQRDVDQRTLSVDYTLDAVAAGLSIAGVVLTLTGALTALAGVYCIARWKIADSATLTAWIACLTRRRRC